MARGQIAMSGRERKLVAKHWPRYSMTPAEPRLQRALNSAARDTGDLRIGEDRARRRVGTATAIIGPPGARLNWVLTVVHTELTSPIVGVS